MCRDHFETELEEPISTSVEPPPIIIRIRPQLVKRASGSRTSCLYAANLVTGLCVTDNEEISDNYPNDRELSVMAWRIRSTGASESPTHSRPNFRGRPLH
jgi:hypothetical protein